MKFVSLESIVCEKLMKGTTRILCKNTVQQEQMDLPRWQNSEALLHSTTNDDLQTL